MFINKRYSFLIGIAGVIVIFLIPTLIFFNKVKKDQQEQIKSELAEKNKRVELNVPYSYEGVLLTLPEGFFVKGYGEYNYARNKNTQDTVVFYKEGPLTANDFDKKDFASYMFERFGENAGKIERFEKIRINGVDAVVVKSSFTDTDEYDVFTILAVLFSDKTVFIAFHEYSDLYSDAFGRCLDTVSVIERTGM